MNTEEHNPGVSFRVPFATYRSLCRAISQIPGVSFAKRRSFFWSGLDVHADFTFNGHNFEIQIDEWDGALWVLSKDQQPLKTEMGILKSAVEQSKSSPIFSWFRSVFSSTYT